MFHSHIRRSNKNIEAIIFRQFYRNSQRESFSLNAFIITLSMSSCVCLNTMREGLSAVDMALMLR